MKKKTETLYVRMPTDLKQWLDDLAKGAGVSLNAYTIMVLRALREDLEHQTTQQIKRNKTNDH
jgi:predicted HicB family RNase H-like nuclease